MHGKKGAFSRLASMNWGGGFEKEEGGGGVDGGRGREFKILIQCLILHVMDDIFLMTRT